MSKFAGYKAIRQLGSGSFGTVELVENSEKELFALKSLLAKHLENQSNINKILHYFRREIDIMCKLDHPNLVKLVDFCDEKGCYQILMQYCDNGNLQNYLKKLRANNELNEQKILDIFYPIASGFEYLHKINIMHRDIKPDNILFHKGIAKVADFGLSISLGEDRNMATTYVGTRITMAPEVLLHCEYSNKADIYSLGVLLYYMFYQTFPFKGKNEMDLCENIKKGNIVFDQTKIAISEQTQDLICLMTKHDPDTRPDITTIRSFPCFHAQIEKEMQENRENIENMYKSCNNQDKPVEENKQVADQQSQPVQKFEANLPKNNEIHLTVNNQKKQQKYYQFLRVKIEQYGNFLNLDGPDPNEMSAFDEIYTGNIIENSEIQQKLANYRGHANSFNEFIKFQQQVIYIHSLIRQIPNEQQMSRNEEKFWEMIVTYIVKQMEAALQYIQAEVDQAFLKYDFYLEQDMKKIKLTMSNIILNQRKQWGQKLVDLEEKKEDKSQFMSQIQESAADLCSAYFRRMNRAKEEQLQSQYLSLQLLMWNLVQMAVGNQIGTWSGFVLFNIKVQMISSDGKKNFLDGTPITFNQ